MKQERLIIIGAGPAGLTAAIYTARADLKPLVFAGMEPGGQLTETSIIENYPGFPEGILGQELMNRFRIQAERFGANVVDYPVDKVDLRNRPFILTVRGEEYQAEALIVATGATARWMEIESEKRLKGKGISACATCDGPMFRNKNVIVIGGGDTAMEEALFLAKFASQIIIIHRREEFRASKIMLERARNHPKIKILVNKQVKEYLGDKFLEGVILTDTNSGKEEKMAIDGAFLAIGHVPNTKIFKEFLTTNDKDYLEVKNPPVTDIPGVFVAGDVFDWRYRQAVTAAGSGAQAAIEAEKFLEDLSAVFIA